MGAISFVQAPGPNNVLGKVKFVYPNPYTVYMHDTIKPGLFDKDSRAEGHNCPRVFKPGKIAAVVLAAAQNMPQTQVDKLLADGYNSAVAIQHHFPVHTTLPPRWMTRHGHADIYKLDSWSSRDPARRRKPMPSPTMPPRLSRRSRRFGRLDSAEPRALKPIRTAQ